ncbi:MAG: T9SS type A sorting domain-containing protein [Taibaiella sp.]|nr:T9SS type A sorting domain-containing protein [Taibaiella sp.]
MKMRMSVLLSYLCFFRVLVAFSQPYQVGHISASFVDATRSNRTVPAEIYYPADVAGDNAPFAASYVGKAPVIAFGHGFVMTQDAYANVRDVVVSNGYIIAFPTSEGSFSPAHSAFGRDLVFVLRQVDGLGMVSSSVLFNKVDAANCVMGHSMGGGAALLAASYDSYIKSIVTFAAAETSPSAISAAATVSVPALVFAGENDCVTPPSTNQQPMYTGLASACKQYIGIKGGSHCQMAGSSITCSFGEASCSPAPTITRGEQHAKLAQYLVPWLNYTLKGNCPDGAYFDATAPVDANISYTANCMLCSSSSVSHLPVDAGVRVHPNPVRGKVWFTFARPGSAVISLYSAIGQKVFESSVASDMELSVPGFPAGVYIYSVERHGEGPVRGTLLLLD